MQIGKVNEETEGTKQSETTGLTVGVVHIEPSQTYRWMMTA